MSQPILRTVLSAAIAATLFSMVHAAEDDTCQFQFTKRQFYKISIKYIQYSKELCDKFTNQCCDKTKKLHLTMRQK